MPTARRAASTWTSSWPITDRFGGIDKDKAPDARLRGRCPARPGSSRTSTSWSRPPLENQITAENAALIRPRVRLIAEGANGPTTSEADRLIAGRGIFVIPDILANAGGVTCSYFEQVQSNMNYYWEKDEVLGKLDVKMTSAAFQAVLDLSPGEGSSPCATRPS